MVSTLFDTEIENENMFEIELEQNEKLPIELFQELETELLDSLLHKDNNNDLLDDETDGPMSEKNSMELWKKETEKRFSIFSLKF